MTQKIENLEIQNDRTYPYAVKLSRREINVAKRIGYQVMTGKRHVTRPRKKGQLEHGLFTMSFVVARSDSHADEIIENIKEGFGPND